MPPSGLQQFMRLTRASIDVMDNVVRAVYRSDVASFANGHQLQDYIADRTPLFYRDIPGIVDSLGDGYFVSTFRECLARLPNSQWFQESHFGEIAALIFAEEILGLVRLYSKLSLLTAENANAYKMDLVLCDLSSDPVSFVFGEVKSSTKTASDGIPARHDNSCYAEVFRSLNEYSDSDLQFDIAAIKDRLNGLPDRDQRQIRSALLPYANPQIRYAAFTVIDSSTYCDQEAALLATRRNQKDFEADVICVESLPQVAHSAFQRLERIREACSV